MTAFAEKFGYQTIYSIVILVHLINFKLSKLIVLRIAQISYNVKSFIAKDKQKTSKMERAPGGARVHYYLKLTAVRWRLW